jgi:hypothetical protein
LSCQAPDLKEAVKLAEQHFGYAYRPWKNGQADVALLVGEDLSPKEEAMVVVHMWRNPAYNMGRYPAWFRLGNNEWLDQETLYGKNK